MTRITYGNDGGVYSLIVSGHAEGSQAACAGISAIVGALAGYVENNPVLVNKGAVMRPGYFELEAYGGVDTAAVFEMAYIGLAQIAKQYPESVEVKCEVN